MFICEVKASRLELAPFMSEVVAVELLAIVDGERSASWILAIKSPVSAVLPANRLIVPLPSRAKL
jgi:hypothetical protein